MMSAKTLDQINREFMEEYKLTEPERPPPAERKRRKAVRPVMDVALYTAVFIILIAALFFNGSADKGFHIFDYTGFTVIGTSMQSEIPEGSLVLARKTGSEKIMIGDDITFISSDHSIVTHRVLETIENYEDSNDRGFRTQGIDNSAPDKEIVYAENVIGVVIHTIPGLGTVLTFISESIGIFLLTAIIVLAAIRLLVRRNQKNKQSQESAND